MTSPWRKSRRSFSNGACAEVAAWRTASGSLSNGHCLEAAQLTRVIGVRDTVEATHPYRVTLEFQSAAWQKFITAVKQAL